jgi:hypothetical protein
VLPVFIEDATGKLLQLQFVNNESFFSYAQAAKHYFRRCDKRRREYLPNNAE